MNVDLHTHTTASDGTLAPGELLAAAADAGVDLLSITDHDNLDAYAALGSVADRGPTLVPGIELSTTWAGGGIHIIGLGVDIASAAMAQAVAKQRAARTERARCIAHALRAVGGDSLLDETCQRAGSAAPGRPHFAAALVAAGAVKNEAEAFKRYLGAGKRGDIKSHWASFEVVVEWIRNAGGIAVLAHPAKYRLTRAKLRRLLTAFKEAGGSAMEVVSGRQDGGLSRELAVLADAFELYASCGSDFHRPGQTWCALGGASALPRGCRPVWAALGY